MTAMAVLPVYAATSAVAQAQDAKAPVLKDDYADVNGVRLHYISAGDGPLIIFVHGFFNFSYYWKDQLQEFSRDHRVVAYDQRGYNLSSRPGEVDQYKLKYLIEDLHQLALKLNGNKKFILVAHDWGGIVAFVFTMYYPELVDRLIVSNAPHPQMFEREGKENPFQRFQSNYMITTNGYGNPNETAVEEMTKETSIQRAHAPAPPGLLSVDEMVKSGHYTEADRQKWIDAWSQPGAFRAARNFYRANDLNPPYNETHPASQVARSWSTKAVTQGAKSTIIHVPTAILWGVKDIALQPGNLTDFDKYFTDVKVKLFPDDGHDISAVNYRGFNKAMRDFLDGKLPKESVFRPKDLEVVSR
jgi:pimeloyl-ACP methyl ester carboxylesterase